MLRALPTERKIVLESEKFWNKKRFCRTERGFYFFRHAVHLTARAAYKNLIVQKRRAVIGNYRRSVPAHANRLNRIVGIFFVKLANSRRQSKQIFFRHTIFNYCVFTKILPRDKNLIFRKIVWQQRRLERSRSDVNAKDSVGQSTLAFQPFRRLCCLS